MTLDELILEWSYRTDKGYPCLDNPSDIAVLRTLLERLNLPAEKIIDEYDNKAVFGEIRCVGGCFSEDESIKIEIGDEIILKMKKIFQEYDFEEYDSEEEELGKVIRSIINFADQEADLKKIFND